MRRTDRKLRIERWPLGEGYKALVLGPFERGGLLLSCGEKYREDWSVCFGKCWDQELGSKDRVEVEKSTQREREFKYFPSYVNTL